MEFFHLMSLCAQHKTFWILAHCQSTSLMLTLEHRGAPIFLIDLVRLMIIKINRLFVVTTLFVRLIRFRLTMSLHKIGIQSFSNEPNLPEI